MAGSCWMFPPATSFFAEDFVFFGVCSELKDGIPGLVNQHKHSYLPIFTHIHGVLMKYMMVIQWHEKWD